MWPVLFWIGSSPVPTHDFFILLGVVAGLMVFLAESRRREMLDERVLWVVVGALLGGAVGAKLSAVWRYEAVAPHPTVVEFLASGGRSILGGLAGAYAGALVTKRLVGYAETTGDLFAPAVALAMAIGRWGCFLTEQIGTPTKLPWGIRVSPAAAVRIPNCRYCATGVAMHPSFLYEIIFHSVMFMALWWWLRPRVHAKGELFKIYVGCYALFRFMVEFVRGNDVVWAGLTRSQLFLIPAGLVLATYFWRQWVCGAYAAGSDVTLLSPQPGAPRKKSLVERYP